MISIKYMMHFKCECGESVVIDYSKASKTLRLFRRFYEWSCSNCGRLYYKRILTSKEIEND